VVQGGLAIRSGDLRDTPLVGQGEDLLLPRANTRPI